MPEPKPSVPKLILNENQKIQDRKPSSHSVVLEAQNRRGENSDLDEDTRPVPAAVLTEPPAPPSNEFPEDTRRGVPVTDAQVYGEPAPDNFTFAPMFNTDGDTDNGNNLLSLELGQAIPDINTQDTTEIAALADVNTPEATGRLQKIWDRLPPRARALISKLADVGPARFARKLRENDPKNQNLIESRFTDPDEISAQLRRISEAQEDSRADRHVQERQRINLRLEEIRRTESVINRLIKKCEEDNAEKLALAKEKEESAKNYKNNVQMHLLDLSSAQQTIGSEFYLDLTNDEVAVVLEAIEKIKRRLDNNEVPRLNDVRARISIPGFKTKEEVAHLLAMIKDNLVAYDKVQGDILKINDAIEKNQAEINTQHNELGSLWGETNMLRRRSDSLRSQIS
jgi:hypothetical protein